MKDRNSKTMRINILPGTDETLDAMKGQKLKLHIGEGIVYLKLVMVKPETMENGDPKELIKDAPGVVLCGQLESIKDQFNKWFDVVRAAQARRVVVQVDASELIVEKIVNASSNKVEQGFTLLVRIV